MSPTQWVECQCISELHGWAQARNQHLLCPGSVDRGATPSFAARPWGTVSNCTFFLGFSETAQMSPEWHKTGEEVKTWLCLGLWVVHMALAKAFVNWAQGEAEPAYAAHGLFLQPGELTVSGVDGHHHVQRCCFLPISYFPLQGAHVQRNRHVTILYLTQEFTDVGACTSEPRVVPGHASVRLGSPNRIAIIVLG